MLAPTSLQYNSGPSVSTPQVAEAAIFLPSAKLKYGGVSSALISGRKPTKVIASSVERWEKPPIFFWRIWRCFLKKGVCFKLESNNFIQRNFI